MQKASFLIFAALAAAQNTSAPMTTDPTSAPMTTDPTSAPMTTDPMSDAPATTPSTPAPVATPTPVTMDCGHGIYVTASECCVCDLGWEQNVDMTCSKCAVGFFYDEANDVCSNGRTGAPCSTGLEYPYWGCSVGGSPIGECSAGNKFPCECAGSDNCEVAVANLQSSCYPSGTRMYTSFPNQPLVGQAHSLTFVGCDLSASDVYAVIPAYSDDLSMERMCSSLDTNYSAGGVIPSQCRFAAGQVADIGNSSACDGSVGFSITNLVPESKKPAAHTYGMSEFTFEPITIYEDVFRGTLEEKAAAMAAEIDKENPIFEKEAYFRVCKKVSVMTTDGSPADEWQEVASHDHQVESRDFMYKVAKEAIYDEDALSAAAGMEDGESCCDGLKLGPSCLPLWAFLLLWLLMACCLGAMGYSLHKNKNEIEAQKNNEKYEKFNVDAEMSAMAAKQAEDEDDDI